MKASLKFRDEQKPLFRAKIPLNILGFPFQSGIVAGDSKELSLNLSTFFESGPSLKIAYRPNDTFNPISLVFKSGIGTFGSPISSAMSMSGEFNLNAGQNPSFFLHFKPRFGDFTVKKTQSSAFMKNKPRVGVESEDGSVMVDLLENGKKFAISSSEYPAAGVLSDLELSARTAVPLRKHAVLNFRWGVKLSATEDSAAVVLMKKNNDPRARVSFDKFPLLIMDKIGIEHAKPEDCTSKTAAVAVPTAAWLGVKRDLEMIEAENGALRKAMDELKSEFVAVRSGNNGGEKKNLEVKGDFGGRSMEGEFEG